MVNVDFERYGFLGDGRYPIIYQHGHSPRGDNTMPVFQEGVDAGVDYIEVDGRATGGRKRVLVAHHEHLLEDGKTAIADLDGADLEAVRRDFPELRLVDEILEEHPEHGVSLDPKPDNAKWQIGDYTYYDPGAVLAVEVIRRHNAQRRAVVGSFATQNIEIARAALPGTITTATFEELIEIAKMTENPDYEPEIEIKGKIASVPEIETDFGFGRVITPEFLATCHRLGIRVHAWSYDDPEDIRRLLTMGTGVDGTEVVEGANGVDGIYTNEAAVAIAVAREVGRWPVAGAR